MSETDRMLARPGSPAGPRWPLAGAAVLVMMTWADPAQAFKQSYHEDLTETLLRGQGFDEDSADEVGDSNFYTDVFEASTEAAHADNNRLGAASQRLIDKRTRIGDALNACKRRDALDALGEALHTVQDIYSHSNSIDNGHPVDLLNLTDGTAACDPARNFAPGGLVSGYFSAFGFATGNQCRGIPANWCCHRDLNKDAPGEANGARHPAALSAAGGATLDYLGLVEDDIRSRFPDKADQLVALLKRKQRTVMFVIDDTGSMSGDIAGVKAAANAFLDSIEAAGESPTLGLVTFKDNVTNRGATCNNFTTLRAQINGLFASGGGDCPEAMNSGLLAGLGNFPTGRSDIQIQGGRILLATDASAGDPQLGPTVADQAFIRGVSIDAILTGDCTAEEGFTALAPEAAAPETSSENEPDAVPLALAQAPEAAAAVAAFNPLTSRSARTYLRALTEQTGGVLFNVSRVEVDDVAPTLLSLSAPDAAIVLTRSVEGAPGSSTSVDVPVDETFSGAVTFMVTAATASGLPAFTLRRPDGSVVQPTDPGVTRRTLTSVVSYTIQSPAVGSWQATLTGGARAVLRAFGSTSLRFNGLRYLVPGQSTSRPETDIAPLDGLPVAGASLVADARLTVAPLGAALRLRRQDGGLLAEPVTTARDARHFQAPVTIPEETFLVELSGRTAAGNAYVRQLPVAVVPRTVALRATPDVSVAAPGTTATIMVDVRNASSVPATYTMSISSTLAWPRSGPAPFSLAPGAAVVVEVRVTVPAGTPADTRNDLTLVVQDASSPAARNSVAVAVVAGEPNRPPVCAAAAPSVGLLWPPNHAFADVGVVGVTDPDGDLVAISVTGISQDEAVDAPGSGNTAPDGEGLGGEVARVRAERAGGGDGRVYAIAFRADDGQGGSCSGAVRVGVPKSQNGDAPVDSGQLYDSTAMP